MNKIIIIMALLSLTACEPPPTDGKKPCFVMLSAGAFAVPMPCVKEGAPADRMITPDQAKN